MDVSTIISDALGGGLKTVSDIVHSWVSTKKDKVLDDEAEQELQLKIAQGMADIQQKAIDSANAAQAAEDANITDRWKSDMGSDSWLSKNIRPMVLASLLLFTFIIILADSFHWSFPVRVEFIDLNKEILLLVIGAYFGGRSFEKIISMKQK